MEWVVLVGAGTLEAVWASALAASEGFRRPAASVLFLVALAGSMAGLAYAMTAIPTGTAYAVWAGTGAAFTVALAAALGKERVTVIRTLLLVVLIGAVVGLKAVS